jgi:hypothetical protein
MEKPGARHPTTLDSKFSKSTPFKRRRRQFLKRLPESLGIGEA